MKATALHPLTVAAAVIAIGLAGLGYGLWSVMDDFGACATVEERSIPSPDGRTRIVVFGRACNATVPLNTQLSVSPVDGRFSPETSPPFLVTRASSITAAWRSNTEVEVELPGDAVVYRQDKRVGNIGVSYH